MEKKTFEGAGLIYDMRTLWNPKLIQTPSDHANPATGHWKKQWFFT